MIIKNDPYGYWSSIKVKKSATFSERFFIPTKYSVPIKGYSYFNYIGTSSYISIDWSDRVNKDLGIGPSKVKRLLNWFKNLVGRK